MKTRQDKTRQAKYIALGCIMLTATFFTSCKKEESAPSQNTIQVPKSTKSTNKSLSATGVNFEYAHGRIIFPKIEDYEKAANEQNEELRQQFLAEINATGFKSLSSGKLNTGQYEIKSDFLSAILNENFIVQIQDYIVKLDAKKEEVYLLETTLENQYYSDLISKNPPVNTIIKLDFNDDVIGAMRLWGVSIRCCRPWGGGGGGGPIDICPESGMSNKNNGTFHNGILFTAEYKRYGILSELFAMASPVGSSGWSYSFDFTGGIPSNAGFVHYKPRCISSTSFSIETQGTWTGSTRIYKPFRSTEVLTELYFGYYIKQNGSRVSNTPVTIRQNK